MSGSQGIRIAVTWRTRKVAFSVRFGVLTVGHEGDQPIVTLEDPDGAKVFAASPAQLTIRPIGRTTVGVTVADGTTYRIAGFTAQLAHSKHGRAMIERTGALADPRQIGSLRQLKPVRQAAASSNPMTSGTNRLIQEIAWRPILLGLLQGATEAESGEVDPGQGTP